VVGARPALALGSSPVLAHEPLQVGEADASQTAHADAREAALCDPLPHSGFGAGENLGGFLARNQLVHGRYLRACPSALVCCPGRMAEYPLEKICLDAIKRRVVSSPWDAHWARITASDDRDLRGQKTYT
jgi:hypothetical protein